MKSHTATIICTYMADKVHVRTTLLRYGEASLVCIHNRIGTGEEDDGSLMAVSVSCSNDLICARVTRMLTSDDGDHSCSFTLAWLFIS